MTCQIREDFLWQGTRKRHDRRVFYTQGSDFFRSNEASGNLHESDGAWRSLVARLLWEQDAGSSNLFAPTSDINSLDSWYFTENQGFYFERYSNQLLQ